MPEPTPETLAVWLQDVVATVPDADTLKAFHAAVLLGAKCRDSEILDVVSLGHRAAGEAKVQWFADLARSKGAPIPTVGNEALVTRLAAASTVRVVTAGGGPAIVAGLATQSAAFLGLKPDLPEVASFADEFIFNAADAVRTRSLSYDPIAPNVPGWVDQAVAPPPEGTPPSGRPDWEAPAVAIAKQLDELADEIRSRLGLLDEEYNLLWWSHAGRSITADLAWRDVAPPARRVALVGHELGKQARIPATAMIDGLAAVALGDVAAKHLALADVVIAAREENVALATVEHTLLPISTSAAQANVYSDDDTWKTVVKKVHGIDVGIRQPAAAIARQLIREQHLGKLL
jgi:hypothetical protein